MFNWFSCCENHVRYLFLHVFSGDHRAQDNELLVSVIISNLTND